MKKALQLCLFTLLCTTSVFAQSTWQYLPNAPVSTRWDDVFFLNSQLGWLAGSNGQIYKTTDGGLHWDNVYSTNAYFRCIEFFNENIGYAGTLDQKFLRTTDGGKTWTNLAINITPQPEAVCGISIVDSLHAYAVGEWDSPAFFLKTTDGGLSWTRKNMTTYAKALVDVFFISRDTGFVTGQSTTGATILYTTDGGTTWKEKYNSNVSFEYLWKIQRVTSAVWVGSIQTSSAGGFIKSTDQGKTWKRMAAPVVEMQGIGFATPDHGWVGGWTNGMYETIDGGATWQFKSFGANFNRFYFLSPTLAFASGASIYKFTDGMISSATPPVVLPPDDFQITISPNPTHDRMKVEFHLPVQDIVRMSIVGTDGTLIRTVYHQRLAPGDYQFETNCADLPVGTYVLGIQRNSRLYSRTFSKL